jgi:hypothetical protein
MRPVISDVATERRFSTPRLLIERGVQSTVNVVIRGEKGPPFGVLEVDSRQRRSFGQDDIDFLQNYANLLASAVERLDRQQELEQGMKRQQFLFNELQHRVNNMLTTIRAVARRTRAHSPNLDQFVKLLMTACQRSRASTICLATRQKWPQACVKSSRRSYRRKERPRATILFNVGPTWRCRPEKLSSYHWHFMNSRPTRSGTERFPQRTAASASHGSLIAQRSTCSCAGGREVSLLSSLQYGAVLALNFLKNQSSICLAAVLTEHFILTELNVRCSFGLKLTLPRPVSDMPQRYRSRRANNNMPMPDSPEAWTRHVSALGLLLAAKKFWSLRNGLR